MALTEWTTRVAEAFDLVGAATLVVGFVWAIVVAARTWRSAGGQEGYRQLRSTFGGALLLALEVLVADPLRTGRHSIAPVRDACRHFFLFFLPFFAFFDFFDMLRPPSHRSCDAIARP